MSGSFGDSPFLPSLHWPQQSQPTENNCLISEMLNSLWAIWDSLKSVIKALCLSKLKSLRGGERKKKNGHQEESVLENSLLSVSEIR